MWRCRHRYANRWRRRHIAGRSPRILHFINRVEAFSDGVFAIAITLLALGLEVPQVQLTASPSLLLHALLAEWPRFAIFVLSFVLIGEVWVNHHRMFSYIHQSAHWLI